MKIRAITNHGMRKSKNSEPLKMKTGRKLLLLQQKVNEIPSHRRELFQNNQSI